MTQAISVSRIRSARLRLGGHTKEIRARVQVKGARWTQGPKKTWERKTKDGGPEVVLLDGE